MLEAIEILASFQMQSGKLLSQDRLSDACSLPTLILINAIFWNVARSKAFFRYIENRKAHRWLLSSAITDRNFFGRNFKKN